MKSFKSLRGFLGLTWYYRKFIQYYSLLDAPLTALLRKNCFQWFEAASQAFEKLKPAMTKPCVLALPNFSKHFLIECDAFGVEIEVVLMQKGRPLVYLSHALRGKALDLSTYEKKLALVFAVKKWRFDLLGRPFIIRTDQKWISKLLGYDFVIEYKKGR